MLFSVDKISRADARRARGRIEVRPRDDARTAARRRTPRGVGPAIAATPRTMTEAALREHVERRDLTHDRRDMSPTRRRGDDDDDDLGVGGGLA